MISKYDNVYMFVHLFNYYIYIYTYIHTQSIYSTIIGIYKSFINNRYIHTNNYHK